VTRDFEERERERERDMFINSKNSKHYTIIISGKR
jgi:hypothetical protein